MAFILFLIAVSSSFDTISQVILKSAINELKFSPSLNLVKIFGFIFRLIAIPRIWISFCVSFLSLCVWLFVLSKTDLNLAFSLDSVHYIFIAFASRMVLKEKVGLKRWVGTFLIVVGIILVTLS